jgi:thiamine biosynthesis lipoprotein ApbE
MRFPSNSLTPASTLSRSRLAAVLLLCSTVTWLALAHDSPVTPAPAAAEFYFHHDHVIGTSLDVWVVAADEKAALACDEAILAEIERLRRIFSTYDAQSELSRLNRASGPVPASPDLLAVLRAYEVWQQRSSGAFSGQLGELVRLWRLAQKTGTEPDADALQQVVSRARQPGWVIDDANHTVTRLTDQPLDLNSIAKGYIIQQGAAAARARVPALEGLLLNLGGDMAAWGRTPWTVGVQDPFHPEDNAVPLTLVELRGRAVATSGGYERYYTVSGKRYSHIFDPRTGQPATGVASSTVVAGDNVTANVLATTLCVLAPEEGLRLVAATAGAECLLVTADGRQLRSPGWAGLERPLPPRPAVPVKAALDNWPAGYQVNLTVTLPSISDAKKYRRPYVAVWIENADGKPVRTLQVWGNSSKYQKDLTQWWKFAKDDAELVKAVTRATRPPGKYSLVWDGKDDMGNLVPQGTYTVIVEVHREHGKHVRQQGKIECAAARATATLERNAETEPTLIEYAEKKAP